MPSSRSRSSSRTVLESEPHAHDKKDHDSLHETTRRNHEDEAQEMPIQECHDEENPAPLSPQRTAKDPNIVEWDENESANPRNWRTSYKAWVTLQLGMLALAASTGSSIIAPAENDISSEFGISTEVTVLAISLYILGFAFGPLIWAPSSEIWGRRVSMLPAMLILGLFSIGTATSQSAAAVFITRFFAGVFGSAPVSNVSAALGDIWDQKARGTAIVFYAVMVVGGPTLGPVIGSALTANPHLGWRWTEYIEAIWTFAVTALAIVCLPEMYGPVLLKRKAMRLRKETGNQALYHPHERIKLDFRSLVEKQFSRPLLMLFTEPTVTVIAFYASFCYAVLYLTLEVFPIVFADIRGYGPVVSTLPFLGLFVGVLGAVGINLGNQPRYIRKVNEAGGRPVPEACLPPMMIGAVLFVAGLFLFGWTSDPKFHWIIPCVGAAFIGAGFSSIFQQCIAILVSTYTIYAASAVSANTFLRSVLAAGLPLAAKPMFTTLGVGPAMSIIGAVAAALLPVPFILLRFGVSLRRRSKFVKFEEPKAKTEKAKQTEKI